MSVQVKTKCQAADPSTCRYHGNPTRLVDQVKNKVNDLFNSIPVPVVKENFTPQEQIQNALNTSLNWDGPKPAWWKKYDKEELSVHPFGLAEAKIIDVIPSPVGDLAVIWETEALSKDFPSTLGSGFGMRTVAFRSMKTGEVQGYLKMTYMDKETIARSFGDDEFTAFRWKERFGGSNLGFDADYGKTWVYGERNLTGEELIQKRRETWLNVRKYITREGLYDPEGNYVSAINIQPEHAPDDEQIRKDLAKASKQIWKNEINNSLKYYEEPFVDFSKVGEDLRGKGLGTALYVYSSRMLAREENHALRGSGIQSPEAETVWKRFKEIMPKKVKTHQLDYRGKKKESFVLDFRTQ